MAVHSNRTNCDGLAMEIPLCTYPFSLYVTWVLRPFNPPLLLAGYFSLYAIKTFRRCWEFRAMWFQSRPKLYGEAAIGGAHKRLFARFKQRGTCVRLATIAIVTRLYHSMSAQTSAVIIARTADDLDNKFPLQLPAKKEYDASVLCTCEQVSEIARHRLICTPRGIVFAFSTRAKLELFYQRIEYRSALRD